MVRDCRAGDLLGVYLTGEWTAARAALAARVAPEQDYRLVH